MIQPTNRAQNPMDLLLTLRMDAASHAVTHDLGMAFEHLTPDEFDAAIERALAPWVARGELASNVDALEAARASERLGERELGLGLGSADIVMSLITRLASAYKYPDLAKARRGK